MVHETDIAVIGAGIIGAACAAELARTGHKVVLLDAAAPTAGSSGACDGYVSVSTKIPGLAMQLAQESRRLYPEWVARLGVDTHFRETEGLLIVEDEADWPKVEAHAGALASVGVRTAPLAGAEARRREPCLAPELAGVLLCEGEAHIAPYLMTLALADHAVANGARTLWRARLKGADIAGDRVVSIDTDAGLVKAEQYVVATGVWSCQTGDLFGLALPVIPRRGELIVTARRLLSTRPLVSARYLTAKADPYAAEKSDDPLVKRGYGSVMEPTAAGQQVIGSTRTFSGYDRRTDSGDIAMMLREAIRRVPAIAELKVLRTFAGLRPFVPDKKPLIGRSRIRTNVLVATGHEGDGITMAPITGRLVAGLARGDAPPFDIDPLDPDRFAHATDLPIPPKTSAILLGVRADA